MGLFSRISKILSANLSDLLDRAENPEKMLRLLVRRLEEGLQEARAKFAASEASKAGIVRSLEQEKRLSNDWAQAAEKALSLGNEDLARKALYEKHKHDLAGEARQEELLAQEGSAAQLRESLVALEVKVAEARERLDTLIARSRIAEATSLVSETMSALSDSASAFTEFERMEEKVLRQESLAKAARGLPALERPVEESFQKMEAERAVEKELDALRKKLPGGT